MMCISLKEKEQIIINTWHAGGAYKKVGLSYDKSKFNIDEMAK